MDNKICNIRTGGNIMRIEQITPSSLKGTPVSSINEQGLYRILVCDDGKYGKSHLSARLKAVKTISVEDLMESFDSPNCAFIKIHLED
jgi:hypothetical protein